MLRLIAAFVVSACVVYPAAADVVDVSPSGFLVRHEVSVNATPDAIWKALVDVGSWWNPDHSYSRQSANLTIDARPGGCFCEKLANGGGGVAHGTVIFAFPGALLRISATLGPLQAAGTTGSLTWKITPPAAGQPQAAAKLEMTYSVGGYFQGGFDKIAPPVNGVMTEQVNRLKSFIETGKPAAPK